jgi:hypothetical protein
MNSNNKERIKCIRGSCDEDAVVEIPFPEFGGACYCEKHFQELKKDPEEQEGIERE